MHLGPAFSLSRVILVQASGARYGLDEPSVMARLLVSFAWPD